VKVAKKENDLSQYLMASGISNENRSNGQIEKAAGLVACNESVFISNMSLKIGIENYPGEIVLKERKLYSAANAENH